MPANVRKTTNVRTSSRTSTEAAEALAGMGNTHPESNLLEATGELASSISLPPAAPDAPRPVQNLPPHVAADLELAVKWGLEDYGRIAEEASNGRVTRRAARIMRGSEAVDVATTQATYRGHRGMRERTSAASQVSRTTVRAHEVQHSAPLQGQEGAIAAASREDTEAAQEGERLASLKARLLSFLSPEVDTRDWKFGLGKLVQGNNIPKADRDLPNTASDVSPTWFDLCNDSDQLGPVPEGWGVVVSARNVPSLPAIEQSDQSLMDEFWYDVDSSLSEQSECDSEEEVQKALGTGKIDFHSRDGSTGMVHAWIRANMAVIHEVRSDAEDMKPLKPSEASNESRHGKHVPRNSSQRAFLARFVSEQPEPSKSHHPSGVPEAGSGGRARGSPAPARQNAPAQFRRESSQVPDGGWFRATTASAGGRGPPSSSSSDSTSSSDPESDSSESSDSSRSSSSSSSSEDGNSSDNGGHTVRSPRVSTRLRGECLKLKVEDVGDTRVETSDTNVE